MSKNHPFVSIVMAVYNGEDYLEPAIVSILNQSYKDFELIIIDDGSTDNSSAIITGFKDKRISYYSQNNRGLAAALNNGIAKSKGVYIARMDADDISDKNRLKKQVKFLEENKEIALLGTSFSVIDSRGKVASHSVHLTRSKDLRLEFLVRNPFGHGTVMIRSHVLKNVGSYDENQPIEDYELWWRISRKYAVANLSEDLYRWRIVPSSISHGGSNTRDGQINILIKRIWDNTPMPYLTRGEIHTSIIYYLGVGSEYAEQYLYMVAALCIASLKMRQFKSFIRLWIIMFTIRGGAKALLNIIKSQNSHNYNLRNIYC